MIDLTLPPNLVALKDRLSDLKRRTVLAEGRRAAVLVGICFQEGKSALLYNLRSQSVGSHKGQVSFPGGMKEDADADLVTTALRETHEELGIPGTDIEVLGSFHEIRSPFGVVITPIIAFLGKLDISRLTPNEEIADIFTVSLEDLMNPAHHHLEFLKRPNDGRGHWVPRFTSGAWPIWGLTAAMTHSVLTTLFDFAGIDKRDTD